MVANVELIAATVRMLLEKRGYHVFPTYPPETKSAHLFGQDKNAMYVRVICLTQRITDGDPYTHDYYLFFRNKITKRGDVPEFSSAEFGWFDSNNGNNFVSIFKIHKQDADGDVIEDKDYATMIVERIVDKLEEEN